MSRRKKDKQLRLALFPFLSVITCVIGVLALILASSVLGQMEESQLDPVEFDRQLAAIQQERDDVDKLAANLAQEIPAANDCLAGENARLAEVEALLNDAQAHAVEADQELKNLNARRVKQEAKLADIRARAKAAQVEAQKIAGAIPAAEKELEKQKAEHANAKVRLAKLKELEAAGAQAVSRFADAADNPGGLQLEQNRLQQEVAALGVQLEAANKQAAQLASQKPGENITILSGGSGRGKPVFIECRARDLIHRPSGLAFPRSPIGYPLTGFQGFGNFLKAMKNEQQRTVVLLIRPDAVDTFEVARMQAREAGLTPGFLALPGNAPLKIEGQQP
ncbi:MAG: hypothetical protein CMO64_02290 [Verrucomicrobiales bacterium]|nr:hypothetical protein [Verrucomicrobiales bacterium]